MVLAYSLGCIIPGQFLVALVKSAKLNMDFRARKLLGLIKGASFLGPPWKGSRLANLARSMPLASWVLAVLSKDSPDLKVDSSILYIAYKSAVGQKNQKMLPENYICYTNGLQAMLDLHFAICVQTVTRLSSMICRDYQPISYLLFVFS